MVSLWDMLSLISAATALGGALAGAQSAGGGSVRLGLGVFLGLGLGLLSMAAVRKAGRRVFRTLPLEDTSMRTPARLPLTYLAAVVWALCPSVLLSSWLAESLIRFVLP